jgi:hypothetical protein
MQRVAGMRNPLMEASFCALRIKAELGTAAR